MSDRNCSVPGCGRPHNCRGYCRAHYHRWSLTGDVQADVPIKHMPTAAERPDVVGRIMARSEHAPEGCITFNGTKDANGYGKIRWRGRDWMAHRALWTVQVRPIPTDDDWTIDHLCRNRACVNVEHMEVVTRWENTRRGGGLLVAASAEPHALTLLERTPVHAGLDLRLRIRAAHVQALQAGDVEEDRTRDE